MSEYYKCVECGTVYTQPTASFVCNKFGCPGKGLTGLLIAIDETEAFASLEKKENEVETVQKTVTNESIPVIHSFTVDKTAPLKNEPILLQWKVEDAVKITLNLDQERDVTHKNDLEIIAINSKNYVLKAYNTNNEYVKKELKITVRDPEKESRSRDFNWIFKIMIVCIIVTIIGMIIVVFSESKKNKTRENNLNATDQTDSFNGNDPYGNDTVK